MPSGSAVARPIAHVLLVFGLLAAGVIPAWAQEDQPTDDEVNAIAKGLYCPVCENVPLDVCPTVACQQWRETIREKLAAGWSQRQIEDYFVEQYGDRVLATPPPNGLNWLVYVLPPIAFVAGAVILAGAMRSWGRADDSELEPADLPADDPYLQQLEQELARRGEG
jgi:cytochrome c-type biogenesis protein CcmH